MAASFAIGFFINNPTLLITAIVVTLGFSLIPVAILFHNSEKPAHHSYLKSFRAMTHRHLRAYLPIAMLRSLMHIEKFLIPLYIFLIVGDLQMLTIYIIASTLVEMVAMMIFGMRFDRNRRHTFSIVTFFRILSTSLLIFRPIIENIPIVCQIFSRITGRGHDNIYQAYEQRIIKKSGIQPSIASSGIESTICISEMIACTAFSFLATTIGHDIFFLVFLASIVATWLIFLLLRRI